MTCIRSPSYTAERASETAAALAEPLAQEIIAPIGEAYKYAPWSEMSGEGDIVYRFAHDRLQQAAYAVTPAGERPRLHDHIGRLIMERSTLEQREERLFEIVGHLNLASAVITSPERRAELAQLNLHAGQKARGSNAYEAALSHFTAGRELVEARFDARLRHELSLGRIEAMYLCGRFEEAEHLAEELLAQTEFPLEKVEVLEQLVLAHTTRLQYRKAIETAVRALALLGENIPGRPSQLQVLAELARVKLALVGKQPDDMLALPRMKNPQKLAAMRILMLATAPAYFSFKLGGVITCFMGIAIMPWKLLDNYKTFIFGWLGGYAAFLGPVAGIMICDYWVIRKRSLLVDDLYLRGGAYEYSGGFNWKAVAALALGAAVALSGLVVPGLRFGYDYSWFVGFVVSFASYYAMMA